MRAMTALAAISVAAGIVAALFVTPRTEADPTMPAATAHGDDMIPSGRPAPSVPIPAAPRAPAPAHTDARGGGDLALGPPTQEVTRAPARGREPVFLRIPDRGTESPIERTGMDASRTVYVPEDVSVTAWFTGSRRLDATYGSTVLVGHRDSATQGSGALFGIEELATGSSIVVTSRDGTQHEYVVTSTELVDKSRFADSAPRIFTHRGPHRLVLITCGGAFDEAVRSYDSNVIVIALPAPASSD